MLLPKRKNGEELTQLCNRLAKELFGNKSALCLLQIACKTVLASLTESKESEENLPPNDEPDKFCRFIVKLVDERNDDCCGKFVSLQSPVLSQEDMKQLIQKLQETCPKEVSSTKQILRTDEWIKKKGEIYEHSSHSPAR
jgi:hypothetical protein